MNTKELQLIADLLVKAHGDEIAREGDWWYGIDGHDFNIHSPDDDGMFHINVYAHDEATGTDYTKSIDLPPVLIKSTRMKKFKVPYVRVEHQVYFLEVEAEDEEQAEELARESFDGSKPYEVVHAEEFIQDIEEIKP